MPPGVGNTETDGPLLSAPCTNAASASPADGNTIFSITKKMSSWSVYSSEVRTPRSGNSKLTHHVLRCKCFQNDMVAAVVMKKGATFMKYYVLITNEM